MPTIAINIVNYSLFDTDDYYSKYTMADLEHNKILTDKCALHYFELKKISRHPDKTDKKKLWMQLINSESEEELEMLQQTNVPAIQKGVLIIRAMSDDERTREMARRREIALLEERSALGNARRSGYAEGRAEGITEGMAKGRIERDKEIEEKLRKNGMTEEQIRAILGG
jgi:predicted transposase/invertase (TIGR01784 family)